MHELQEWISWALKGLLGVCAAALAFIGLQWYSRLSKLETASGQLQVSVSEMAALQKKIGQLETKVENLDRDVRVQLEAQRGRGETNAREARETIGRVYGRIEELQKDVNKNHNAIMSTLLQMANTAASVANRHGGQ